MRWHDPDIEFAFLAVKSLSHSIRNEVTLPQSWQSGQVTFAEHLSGKPVFRPNGIARFPKPTPVLMRKLRQRPSLRFLEITEPPASVHGCFFRPGLYCPLASRGRMATSRQEDPPRLPSSPLMPEARHSLTASRYLKPPSVVNPK